MGQSRIKSILLLTYHFPPEIGGIQTRISKYIEIFSKKGIGINVFVVSDNFNQNIPASAAGIRVKYVSGRFRFIVPVIFDVARTIYRRNVDVVHVFTGASTILGCSILLLGKILHKKTVTSFFGSEDFASHSPLPRLLRITSLTLSDGIATNSIHTMNHLPGKFANKAQVILGGSDMYPVTNCDVDNRIVILYVGRLVERKGVDDLIKAFKIVRSKIPDVTLEIVGDGPERNNLEKLVSSLSLSDYVLFRGVLTGHKLQNAYDRSYAVVLPSKKIHTDFADEGLGLSLIEASMFGKPLVGTRNGGIPEIIEDGYNGFLVNEADPLSLADVLIRLINDRGLAKSLGRNSYIRAKKLFTWESSAERLLRLYAD
jgi:glycosyltransferase involved in cell wall biosynthesis